jgi:hypothetical protein
MPEDDKKGIVASIVQNTPLAIVVTGLFLTLLGASGGWAKYGIQITEVAWRIAIGAMGLATAAVGLMSFWGKGAIVKSPDAAQAESYGLKITSTFDDQPVSGRINMRGTYEIKPDPDVEVRIIERSLTSQKFYPKRKVIFDDKRKVWEAIDFQLGTGKTNARRNVGIYVLGKGAQALCNYYDQVSATGVTTGIETLTPDIWRCDDIMVKVAQGK